MTPKAAFGFSARRKTKAVFLLLVLLAGWVIYRYTKHPIPAESLLVLDQALQAHVDSLKALPKARTIYPFNPNYLSDQRGYFLGLLPVEIDRLHAYRTQGKWINSAEDFQRVTGVDSLWIQRYSPYFKFPVNTTKTFAPSVVSLPPIDLNAATPEDFKKISGIGEVLSKRIVAYRKRLGGFVLEEQLDEVYGLKPEVLKRLKQRCSLISPANIQKIPQQTTSLEELAQLPYLSYYEARRIIAFRTKNGSLSTTDLGRIQGFDSLKIKRLTLYLY